MCTYIHLRKLQAWKRTLYHPAWYDLRPWIVYSQGHAEPSVGFEVHSPSSPGISAESNINYIYKNNLTRQNNWQSQQVIIKRTIYIVFFSKCTIIYKNTQKDSHLEVSPMRGVHWDMVCTGIWKICPTPNRWEGTYAGYQEFTVCLPRAGRSTFGSTKILKYR